MTTTTSNLNDMSGPELVAYFNQITGESVKRFATRDAGIKRITAALAAMPPEELASEEDSTAVDKPTPGKAAKTPRKEGAPKVRRAKFDFWPDETPKQTRPGTKRDRLLGMLRQKNGATIEEVMAEIGWCYRDAVDGIRLIHVYVGYGLSEDDNGRIRATTMDEVAKG